MFLDGDITKFISEDNLFYEIRYKEQFVTKYCHLYGSLEKFL